MVKICEVVDGCEDCPRYGDDCDGRGDAEMLNEDFRPKYMQQSRHDDGKDLISRADAVSREWYDDAVKANHELAFTDLPDIPRYYYEKVVGKMAHEINMLKEQIESADAVQGEWIDWLGSGNEWECSICKCSVESHGSIAYKYCPMCGAKMKGGAE